MPAVLALAYAVAVDIAAWSAPAKGFQAFTGRRVAYIEPGGTAERAGLRAGDTIVGIDGAPIASTLDYAAHLLVRAPGETAVLQVERDGARRDVRVALAASPPPWSALAATALAVILMTLGLVARIGRPKDPIARGFYSSSVLYAVVYVGALSWPRLVVHPVLAIVFLCALFCGSKIALDLALEFPQAATRAARRWSRASGIVAGVLGAGCALGLVLAVHDLYTGGGDRGLTWMVATIAIQIALLPVHTALSIWFQVRAHRSAHGERRAQLRWLIFGQAMGAIPLIVAIPFALSDLDRFLVFGYQPFIVAVALVWFVAYGVAVLRIRLADVDALIESSLGYTITTSATVIVYAGVVLAAGWLTGRLVGDAGVWPHLAAALAAAATFGPLRTRVSDWLDRRFFRDRRHYVEALRRTGESLAQLREPADLACAAVTQVVAAVRAESGALYLPGIGLAYAIGDAPAEPVPPPDGLAVAVGDAQLVLGPRKTGDLYSSHDRDLLATLASQLAVALANARAYGTIADLSREIGVLREKLEDENRLLRLRAEAATEGAKLVGDSHAIRELARTVELVSRSDASVLLLGESGTGKGLLAHLIHRSSARAAGPFLRVDCGAVAASLFESELFGHERGAFTGATRLRRGPIELADGGTLVLDEIGELPLELQPKLLRVLEDRAVIRVGATTGVPVNVRVIAATNRKLEQMVARGEFREDLYFRLRVVEITAPPLRSRVADLPALCASLLPRVARRCGRKLRPLAPDALERMAGYAWPGNVRELENVLERALVLAEGPQICAADLDLPDRPPPPELIAPAEGSAPHDLVMQDIERRRLASALRDAAGNQSNAARALGIPRTTFVNKLRRYGLV